MSARFHIRPKISFGNLARSKICLAVSPVQECVSYRCWIAQFHTENMPGRTPLLATSDLSNNDVNLLTSSGFNGGTRTGPPTDGGGLVAPTSRLLGTEASTAMPSNLGNGPARKSNKMSARNFDRNRIASCTHVEALIPLSVDDQLEHVQSSASQRQTLKGSGAPCSPCPRSAISVVP